MAIPTPITPHALPERALIALHGEGVLSFLHNILTCNVEVLPEGGLAYGALLSPQGKILHDVFIHHHRDVVMVDCAAAGADDLMAKLKLYRLRAKFEITQRDDVAVVAGAGTALDPRHAALGLRGVFAKGSHAPGEAYDTARYALGIADSAEIGSGALFPHEANFDVLKAVDFKKGCYIGQEVVSRMQHRGTTRSRIVPVTFSTDQHTDELRIGDVLIGEVLGRRGRAGLALVRLDRLAEAQGEAHFSVHKPDWMEAL